MPESLPPSRQVQWCSLCGWDADPPCPLCPHYRDPSQGHNHLTRDIKDRGVCPACDYYWERSEEANDD